MGDGGYEKHKRKMVARLRETYRDRCSAIQPIPFIKNKAHSVQDLFVPNRMLLETDGSLDTITSYRSLFTDEQSSTVRFLIRGGAGYGKSTLLLLMANDWRLNVESSPLSNYEILILLNLRQMGKISSIYRAIKLFLLGRDPQYTTEDIRMVLAKCTSTVILLDSYDEYCEQDSDSKCRDIGRILKGEMFPNAVVVVASRHVPEECNPGHTKRVSLIGFGKESRKEYASKALVGKSGEEITKLLQSLEKPSVLSHLCQIPLFFVMYVHIPEERATELVTSVTSFFKYVLRCLFSHMKNKTRDDNVGSYSTKFEREHDDLNKVSLECIRDKKELKWSNIELKKQIGTQLHEFFVRAGLLVEEHSFTGLKSKTSVQFYHDIFAQWFAASEVSAINKMSELETVLDQIDPVSHPYIFRFACGLSPPENNLVMNYLTKKHKSKSEFVILCNLEQSSQDLTSVAELCSNVLKLTKENSMLLQSSTVGILQLASANRIPISTLVLNRTFTKFRESGGIALDSGIDVPSLSSLEELVILTKHGYTMEGDQIKSLPAFLQQFTALQKLSFDKCIMPETLPDLGSLHSTRTEVTWQKHYEKSPRLLLDSKTGRWERYDVQSDTGVTGVAKD